MITRREVLKAGAAVALSPIVRSISTLMEPDSFRFAFFSDSHVGLEGHLAECKSMLHEMTGLSLDFAINAGDITDYGWTDEYTNYRALLKQVPFKVYAAPGNHDVRWSPLGPKAFREGTGAPMFGSFNHKGVHFVTLDSTIPLSHYGHFERKMLQWLESDLRRCGRETPVFIAFHHWVGRDGVQLDNETDLLRVIEPYNVKVLLNGHGHSNLLWTWNGISNTMNKGLYQLSYEQIEVDRIRNEIRMSRRTQEHPAMAHLLTVPLGPSREKRRIWNVNRNVVAGAVGVSIAELPMAKEYRWDDHPWKPISASTAPTDGLVEGTHRLTVRSDPQTYFAAGEVTIQRSSAPSALRKRWERELSGGVMSHLRLADDRLFVSTMDGAICSFRAEDGHAVWTARTDGYCHSSPLVLSESVIVGSADTNVYAFDRQSGKQRWKFPTGGPVYATGAEAHGIVAIGSGDGSIYGLEVESGRQIWRFDLPKSHTAFVQSPACTDGDRFYFGAWDKFVYALDVRTGELAWKHDCCGARAFAYSPAIGGPVVGGGKVYVPTDGDDLFAFDARTGEVIWKVSPPGDKVGYSGPCLVGDRIFIGCLGDIGQARCFSTVDGKILWTSVVGSTIYDSSPSHADGVVAIGSVIGLLTAMNATNGEIIGQYQLPPGHFLASPVSSPGRIYAASYSNRIAAFDVHR